MALLFIQHFRLKNKLNLQITGPLQGGFTDSPHIEPVIWKASPRHEVVIGHLSFMLQSIFAIDKSNYGILQKNPISWLSINLHE